MIRGGREDAVEQPVGLLTPFGVAGQRREANEILHGDGIRIGDGVVTG